MSIKLRWLLLGALLAMVPTTARAQTATPSNKLAWDQPGPDLATVSAYTYKYYPDGGTTGTALTGVTCLAPVSGSTAAGTCSVAFPAFTPGTHTLTLTASNAAGESAQSAALSFRMVVIPAVPLNLRVQ